MECLPFDDYGFLHLTGILPPLSDSTREASFYLMDKAREHGLTISFDPNLRPQLWPDQETMAQVINALAARADYVFPGTAEGKLLMGSSDPEEINRFYLELGVKTVITKCGSKGAYVSTPEGSFWSEGFRVEKVVDTVGAGRRLCGRNHPRNSRRLKPPGGRPHRKCRRSHAGHEPWR